MYKNLKLLVICALTVYLGLSSVSLADTSNTQDRIFYLGKEGFLIEFDTENTTEIGKYYLGEMPFAMSKYKNKIYSTDFAKDTIYEYDIESKSIKKENIDFLSNATLADIYIYQPPTDEMPKSVLRKIIEPKFGDKRYKQKKLAKQKKSPIVLDLPIHKHNKKLGLSALTNTKNNIYAISTLQERVLVLDRETLKFSHSYYVGQRPTALGLSPDEKYLAVASGALNKLFVINTQTRDKVLELDVSHAPTKINWLDNNNLALLNRGAHTVSIVNINSDSVSHEINIPVYINSMILSEDKSKLYVLSGNNFKVYTVELDNNYKYTEKEIPEGMYFPDGLLELNNNNLLISSHRDKKLLILDLENQENNKKIQANFSPLRLLKIQGAFSNTVITETNKKENKDKLVFTKKEDIKPAKTQKEIQDNLKREEIKQQVKEILDFSKSKTKSEKDISPVKTQKEIQDSLKQKTKELLEFKK